MVERNISYFNGIRNFEYNGGEGEIFRFNTACNQGETGFKTGTDTIVEYNIATSSDHQSNTDIHDGHNNNSWQMQGNVEFISTSPTSRQFLQPVYGSAFDGVGVYGH